jgi:SMP-30/Gluconolactonase/LRE-like region
MNREIRSSTFLSGKRWRDRQRGVMRIRWSGALGALLMATSLWGSGEPAARPPADPEAAAAAFTEGMAALQAKDVVAYRAKIEFAASLLPDSTRLLYRLASARLLAGDKAGALAAFQLQVEAGYWRDPRQDPDFAPLLGDASFTALLTEMDALKTALVSSTPAFELPERDLLAEGIAFDPASKAFWISSVRQQKIWRRTAAGQWEAMDGFPSAWAGSPLGMVVDVARGRLWVAAAGLPHGGAGADLEHRGGVAAIDLATGKRIVQAGPFARGESTNDLALAADGSVFVSDPEAKAIVQVTADGRRRVVVHGSGLRSPGGLALTADERLLYVADWSNGLAVVELATCTLSWMRPPAGTTLLGIDGLVRHRSELVAIQNGVEPQRIARLGLSADGLSVASARLLERAVPEWDEPTLGVIVDGALYYIAASQWPRYGDDGKPAADLGKLPLASVRRLALD